MTNDFNSISRVLSKIDAYQEICIISHVNPDGDSLGSLLSLGLALGQLKENGLTLALDDEIPSSYEFLPQIDLIKAIDTTKHFNLLITLDCADKTRTGLDDSFLKNNVDTIVNIDHHISNTKFGDFNLVDTDSSSTGEIVYKLLTNMKLNISKDIATCIYVALSTDTGSFKYDNTSSKTHLVASELIDSGIDINWINTELYQNRSLEKTRLLIESLKTMELYENNKIGIAIITKEMFNNTNANIHDADSIVEFIRDIDTVKVACILKEFDTNITKISLRSKYDIDVAKIAISFGGGGHTKASGCTICESIEKAKLLVLDKIKDSLR